MSSGSSLHLLLLWVSSSGRCASRAAESQHPAGPMEKVLQYYACDHQEHAVCWEHSWWEGCLPGNGAGPLMGKGLHRGLANLSRITGCPPPPLSKFPKAAVTNHHKEGGLKQQKCILSSSRGQKSIVKAPIGPHSLRRLQGRILPGLSWLLVVKILDIP